MYFVKVCLLSVQKMITYRVRSYLLSHLETGEGASLSKCTCTQVTNRLVKHGKVMRLGQVMRILQYFCTLYYMKLLL